LYAQAEKRGRTEDGETASDFAAGATNLLVVILVAITFAGELALAGVLWWRRESLRIDRLLLLQFTMVMLPYVLLVCGGAFLSAILQVHKRFGPPAFAPVLLNVCHIVVVAGGAWWLGLHGKDDPTAPAVIALQTKLAFGLAVAVIVAGVLQVAVLLPALRQSGFRFRPTAPMWTPATRQMLRLSVPLAISAGVLQASVLLDEMIGYWFMRGQGESLKDTHFHLLGYAIRYPLELGAPRRLDLAQMLYQFPLGVFAIALATAIFPALSADALEKGRETFKRVLRQGIEATLWEGLPASVGLILIREPITRLMFQHGQIDAANAGLIADSLAFFAAGIWAFSLLQVINRAYYAIHDTRTPLLMSVMNIVVNVGVELALMWKLGEVGIAVGTTVSFALQTLLMLWLLDRRLDGIGIREIAASTLKMLVATALMAMACWAVTKLPVYPHGATRGAWATQIALQVIAGGTVYFGACVALKVNLLSQLKRKKR
jgi:putative peptidoglycan lipid II flippase